MPWRRSAHCGRTAVGDGWWMGSTATVATVAAAEAVGVTVAIRLTAMTAAAGGGGDPLLPLPPWASPIFMFIFIPPRSNEMDRAGLHTVADLESVVSYLVLSLKIPFCHEGYFLVLFGAPA